MSAFFASLLAGLKAKGVSLALGALGAGAIFMALRKLLPDFLAKLVSGQVDRLLAAKDPEDKALVLAIVKWAEAKIPDRGLGHERYMLAADKLVAMFPALAKNRDDLAAIIEEGVARMDEELKKRGQ